MLSNIKSIDFSAYASIENWWVIFPRAALDESDKCELGIDLIRGN